MLRAGRPLELRVRTRPTDPNIPFTIGILALQRRSIALGYERFVKTQLQKGLWRALCRCRLALRRGGEESEARAIGRDVRVPPRPSARPNVMIAPAAGSPAFSRDDSAGVLRISHDRRTFQRDRFQPPFSAHSGRGPERALKSAAAYFFRLRTNATQLSSEAPVTDAIGFILPCPSVTIFFRSASLSA